MNTWIHLSFRLITEEIFVDGDWCGGPSAARAGDMHETVNTHLIDVTLLLSLGLELKSSSLCSGIITHTIVGSAASPGAGKLM